MFPAFTCNIQNPLCVDKPYSTTGSAQIHHRESLSPRNLRMHFSDCNTHPQNENKLINKARRVPRINLPQNKPRRSHNRIHYLSPKHTSYYHSECGQKSTAHSGSQQSFLMGSGLEASTFFFFISSFLFKQITT